MDEKARTTKKRAFFGELVAMADTPSGPRELDIVRHDMEDSSWMAPHFRAYCFAHDGIYEDDRKLGIWLGEMWSVFATAGDLGAEHMDGTVPLSFMKDDCPAGGLRSGFGRKAKSEMAPYESRFVDWILAVSKYPWCNKVCEYGGWVEALDAAKAFSIPPVKYDLEPGLKIELWQTYYHDSSSLLLIFRSVPVLGMPIVPMESRVRICDVAPTSAETDKKRNAEIGRVLSEMRESFLSAYPPSGPRDR